MNTLEIVAWLVLAFCTGLWVIRWFFRWWLVRSARGLSQRWLALHNRYCNNPALRLLSDEALDWAVYWNDQANWVEGGRKWKAPVRPKSRFIHHESTT